jgi:hypothetical protein
MTTSMPASSQVFVALSGSTKHIVSNRQQALRLWSAIDRVPKTEACNTQPLDLTTIGLWLTSMQNLDQRKKVLRDVPIIVTGQEDACGSISLPSSLRS